jgi:hypothetical protein
MNAHRDPDRLIHAFLMEGATELADDVYVAVRDRIEQKRQRAVLGPWREPDVNRYLKIALAVAAVLVVAVVGFRQFGGANVSGPGSSLAPTASPSPSPASPSASAPAAAGQYVFVWPGGGGPSIRVDVPDGWSGVAGDGVLTGNNGGEPPDGAAIIGPFFGDLYVYGDPCQWSTTAPDVPATTVDQVVTALEAQASRDASTPVDVTVDGHAGMSITLHVPDDTVDSRCDEGKFASWGGGGEPPTSGPSRYHQGAGQIDEVWVLDVNGEVVVMDAMSGAETPAAKLAEMRAILESMTFE